MSITAAYPFSWFDDLLFPLRPPRAPPRLSGLQLVFFGTQSELRQVVESGFRKAPFIGHTLPRKLDKSSCQFCTSDLATHSKPSGAIVVVPRSVERPREGQADVLVAICHWTMILQNERPARWNRRALIL